MSPTCYGCTSGTLTIRTPRSPPWCGTSSRASLTRSRAHSSTRTRLSLSPTSPSPGGGGPRCQGDSLGEDQRSDDTDAHTGTGIGTGSSGPATWRRRGQVRFTQNVTPADVRSGILRVPRASKAIFPSSHAQIEIELWGQAHLVSWNPRISGDKERSGVIGVGKTVLASRVTAGDSLRIEKTPTGYRIS